MARQERYFQTDLIKEIEKLLPGCIVTKLDPNHIQGIPDLLVLYGDRYALLENKRSANASKQPNQDYYVNQILEWGAYSAFIYPENKEEILNELQQALQPSRQTCVLKR